MIVYLSSLFYDIYSVYKSALLTQHFEYNDSHVAKHQKGECYRVKLPLAMAMIKGSTKVSSLQINKI